MPQVAHASQDRQAPPVPQTTGENKAPAPGKHRPRSILVKAILGIVAIVAADMAGTILALMAGLSRKPTTLFGYLCAAVVGLLLMRALGGIESLKPRRQAIVFAFDKCGWLLAVNLVLGLITLMPDDGERLTLVKGWFGLLVYVFVECLFIGITEECIFRGLVLGGILSLSGSTKRGVVFGVLLSAGIFGLAHVIGAGDFSPLGLLQAALKIVQAGIIGAAFAAVALTQHNFSGTVLVHALFDFLVMAPTALRGGNYDSTEYVSGGAEGVATALSYVVMIIVYLPVVYLTWQMLRELPAPEYGWFCRADGTPRRRSPKAAAAPVAPDPLLAASGSGADRDGRSWVHASSPDPVVPSSPRYTTQVQGGSASLRGGATTQAPAPSGMQASDGQRGLFITLEGIDGSGKSTQTAFLEQRLRAQGYEVVRLREPGGTSLSEGIRALLLDPSNDDMADECELLLYEASRAQLVREVIEPALARGAIVLCDRFFDSTWAYQHGGRGLDAALVREANRLGSCGMVPTRTIVLDLEAELGLSRATKDGTDRLEAEGLHFQERVRNAYLRLALDEPARVRVVAAEGSVDEVALRVYDAVKDLLDRQAHA